MKSILKKLYDNPSHVSEILEHLMAILVLIGIIIATISIKDSFIEFWHHRIQEGAFLQYLDAIFKIVIGIEFFKLLWKPEKETLVEVLMFVLARHMIMEHSTAFENCMSVISIGLLFLMDKYLLHGSHSLNCFHIKDRKESQKSDS